MEDSYTVHRRRKAAAKRREKTPEPSARNQLVETSEDDEGSMRARMEQMADDAERTELEEREKRKSEEPPQLLKVEEERKRESPARFEEKKSSPLKESRARDSDVVERDETAARSVKRESKADSGSPVKETKVKGEERHDPKSSEPRKVERRPKKKSRERAERRRSTDSSDTEEMDKRHGRTGSPGTSKPRIKKSSTKRTNEPGGTNDAVVVEKPPREKKSTKRKPEGVDVETRPEGRSDTHGPIGDDDTEDRRMKSSESYPGQITREVTRRYSTDVKKQIIPLSDDSLIQDFAKAQREYLKRERSILDPETPDAYEDAEDETTLRRRRFSTLLTPSEQEAVEESIEESKRSEKKKSWFSRFFPGRRESKERIQEPIKVDDLKLEVKSEEADHPKKVTLVDFLRAMKDVVAEFKAFVAQNPNEVEIVRGLRNRCMSELLLVMIYCGLGAFVFRFTEGAFESFYKCGVKRVKRDFLDNLWNYSHNLKEEDWKSMARRKLMEFEEQLHTAHEAGVHTYSGQRSWTFLNAVVYCLTVITTIGYGHISPSTNTGRAITIVYAIFGIPMFLIILADFGKLFTRGIKFLWAFVRRVYYTGSCRKVRRTVPVQEVMKGVQLVYDLATFKRPSQINPEDIEEMQKQAQQSQTMLNLDGNVPDTPVTPAMSTFAVDDEFNLPISVAIFILLGYIFVGATLFCLSEGWGFFESFYFVFISMSTIGFGDYVPKHPIYMMCSIIYLVFGLALTSMCINVVQVMLSDSFRQASQKIGATIGFVIADEDRSVNPAAPPAVEVADVHVGVKESNGSNEKIAPRAKQEDVDLHTP